MADLTFFYFFRFCADLNDPIGVGSFAPHRMHRRCGLCANCNKSKCGKDDCHNQTAELNQRRCFWVGSKQRAPCAQPQAIWQFGRALHPVAPSPEKNVVALASRAYKGASQPLYRVLKTRPNIRNTQKYIPQEKGLQSTPPTLQNASQEQDDGRQQSLIAKNDSVLSSDVTTF